MDGFCLLRAEGPKKQEPYKRTSFDETELLHACCGRNLRLLLFSFHFHSVINDLSVFLFFPDHNSAAATCDQLNLKPCSVVDQLNSFQNKMEFTTCRVISSSSLWKWQLYHILNIVILNSALMAWLYPSLVPMHMFVSGNCEPNNSIQMSYSSL